jgi:nucleotide-binding universal stress UspA family protein
MSDTEQNSANAHRAVVVGIDGSEGSRAALEYALDEAVWRDLPVRAVLAYGAADVWATEDGGVPDARTLRDAADREASSLVESAVGARRSRGEPVPPVEVEVAMGPAPAVLERLSRDAALLVVGHRGRGGFASRFIGSVGLSCVIRAACTVVVVRA